MVKKAGKAEGPSEKLEIWVVKLLPLWIAILGFMLMRASRIFMTENNIASVELVQQRFDQSIKYTDNKFAEAVREAAMHSDQNRMAVERQMEQQTSLIREQGATLKGLEEWMKRIDGALGHNERKR